MPDRQIHLHRTAGAPPTWVLALGEHRSPPLTHEAWLRIRDAAAAVDLHPEDGRAVTERRGELWSAVISATQGWVLTLPRGVATELVEGLPALVRADPTSGGP